MISVVMPTYNRSGSLKGVAESLVSYLDQMAYIYEFIIVDDGSQDETPRVISELSASFSPVVGIILSENVGQQNATLAGIRLAQYERVITVDDDLEYDVEAIALIVKALSSGYEVAYVVNTQRNQPVHRSIGTWIKEVLLTVLCHKPPTVQLTSYRGVNRRVADYVCQDPVGKVYISARLLQLKPKIKMIYTSHALEAQVPSTYSTFCLIKLFMGIGIHYGFMGRALYKKRNQQQYRIREVIQ